MSIICQGGVYSQHLAPNRMPGSNNAAQRDSPLNSLSASLSQTKKKNRSNLILKWLKIALFHRFIYVLACQKVLQILRTYVLLCAILRDSKMVHFKFKKKNKYLKEI